MDVKNQSALVTGGASGLGAATARALAGAGARVAILDRNAELAAKTAAEIDGCAAPCDITDTASIEAAMAKAQEANGPARILINCAGVGESGRTVGRDGPHSMEQFTRVVSINLLGTFDVIRLFAAVATSLEPLDDGERGVIVNTASVAAFDGQIGQVAYSASKGGIVGMTLPIARDLASRGVRVCTIAPGLFLTPMFDGLSEEVQQSLAASIPFPQRLGRPEEYADLAMYIIASGYINGETIRLDGALRMAPR